MYKTNPIMKMDFPEPDVICVEDAYYMISTTLHFRPGGVILRSYDLQHWEIVSYLFDMLEGTPQERMQGEQTAYARGMEHGRLYYQNGTFYASFFSKWMDCTYLFSTKNIEGTWERHCISSPYYDGCLLFDDDNRVYIAFGHQKIWLTELLPDLSGPKPGGLQRLLIEDKDDVYVGYCGTRIYKINGSYYIFVMHWPRTGCARKTQMCFVSDSLEGEFEGREVLCDDAGYHNQGVAQGGLVQTPGGKWYAVLTQDYGAVGRFPMLVPVSFEGRFPEFGHNGRVPETLQLVASRPYYPYEELYTSDDFVYVPDKNGKIALRKQWQWNHQPDDRLWSILPGGGLCIRTAKISANLIHAQNTLTQRMRWPESDAEVLVDARGLKEGDVAGISAFQGCYGLIGITKETGNYYLVVIARDEEDAPEGDLSPDYLPGNLKDKIKLNGSVVRLRITANFSDGKDVAKFYYEEDHKWKKAGRKHALCFKKDHLAGCRYGLFVYSTKQTGGEAVFSDFKYY